jgi:hypothetical protein
MKTPSGLVIAKITSKKKKIWNQPLGVMAKNLPGGEGPSADSRRVPRKLQ